MGRGEIVSVFALVLESALVVQEELAAVETVARELGTSAFAAVFL